MVCKYTTKKRGEDTLPITVRVMMPTSMTMMWEKKRRDRSPICDMASVALAQHLCWNASPL